MGGQLGSSCFADCIAAPQKYLARIFIVPIGTTRVWKFGGHWNFGVPPHFGRGRNVPGLKKLLRQKTSKQTSSAKKLPNSWKFTSRKLQKRKVNLNPQNSWPQKTVWVRGRKSRTRNCYLEPEPQRKTQTQHAPGILMPTCCTTTCAQLKEAMTLRDSRRSTGTETISSAYRKHGAVC